MGPASRPAPPRETLITPEEVSSEPEPSRHLAQGWPSSTPCATSALPAAPSASGSQRPWVSPFLRRHHGKDLTPACLAAWPDLAAPCSPPRPQRCQAPSVLRVQPGPDAEATPRRVFSLRRGFPACFGDQGEALLAPQLPHHDPPAARWRPGPGRRYRDPGAPLAAAHASTESSSFPAVCGPPAPLIFPVLTPPRARPQANEIMHHKATLNGYLAEFTGQTLDKITEDTDRDFFMGAEEAKAYGLIDGAPPRRRPAPHRPARGAARGAARLSGRCSSPNAGVIENKRWEAVKASKIPLYPVRGRDPRPSSNQEGRALSSKTGWAHLLLALDARRCTLATTSLERRVVGWRHSARVAAGAASWLSQLSAGPRGKGLSAGSIMSAFA